VLNTTKTRRYRGEVHNPNNDVVGMPHREGSRDIHVSA
jgi:hypothetical protein